MKTVEALKALYVALGGALTDVYESIADGAPVSDYVTTPNVIEALAGFTGIKETTVPFGKSVAASIDGDGVISDEGIAMLASVGLVMSEDRKTELTRADVARLLYTLSEKN